MVVIGHVDAGKSTLVGRLLLMAGEVDERTMQRYEKEARALNKGSFRYAWVMDQDAEERARGVTIDGGPAPGSLKPQTSAPPRPLTPSGPTAAQWAPPSSARRAASSTSSTRPATRTLCRT